MAANQDRRPWFGRCMAANQGCRPWFGRSSVGVFDLRIGEFIGFADFTSVVFHTFFDFFFNPAHFL